MSIGLLSLSSTRPSSLTSTSSFPLEVSISSLVPRRNGCSRQKDRRPLHALRLSETHRPRNGRRRKGRIWKSLRGRHAPLDAQPSSSASLLSQFLLPHHPKADLGSFSLSLPSKATVEVVAIFDEALNELQAAYSGDNVKIRLKGIKEDEVSPGFVLCSVARPVGTTTRFHAQLAILDSKVRSSFFPFLQLRLSVPTSIRSTRTSSRADTLRSFTSTTPPRRSNSSSVLSFRSSSSYSNYELTQVRTRPLLPL